MGQREYHRESGKVSSKWKGGLKPGTTQTVPERNAQTKGEASSLYLPSASQAICQRLVVLGAPTPDTTGDTRP